ncbi:MAG: amidohydrolase, partial [Candidatus Tectomicrobia bacterium]|nr:amidohydrolase [Candidatus Tectomicrobia bacterium]
MSIVDSGSSPTHHEIFQRATALRSRIQGWREEIHRRPELGFQEFLTSELIAGVLRDLGIETETGVAKTGVVGTIRGGAGDVVALRADMDALRITEKNGTDFDSTREGL